MARRKMMHKAMYTIIVMALNTVLKITIPMHWRHRVFRLFYALVDYAVEPWHSVKRLIREASAVRPPTGPRVR